MLRLAPGATLPPYGFVPGHFPHPVRDPAGHSFGQHHEPGPPPDNLNYSHHPLWLVTLDLLNLGYYWEAHETLEGWWTHLPESDLRRPLFQGLVRLAAAGVKARQGHGAGVHSHLTKASIQLRQVGTQVPGGRLLGLPLLELASQAEALSLKAHTFVAASPMPKVSPVLGLALHPEGE